MGKLFVELHWIIVQTNQELKTLLSGDLKPCDAKEEARSDVE
jgi:hypothetical protein